jgi:hypothetical protein
VVQQLPPHRRGRSAVVEPHAPVPVTPRRNRLAMRARDLDVVQRASATIVELGADLDDQLRDERSADQRLRVLRATTNQITRIANDAAGAYRRASRAVNAELASADADVDRSAAQEMRDRLDIARLAVLDALENAKRRYPWAYDGAEPPPVS